MMYTRERVPEDIYKQAQVSAEKAQPDFLDGKFRSGAERRRKSYFTGFTAGALWERRRASQVGDDK